MKLYYRLLLTGGILMAISPQVCLHDNLNKTNNDSKNNNNNNTTARPYLVGALVRDVESENSIREVIKKLNMDPFATSEMMTLYEVTSVITVDNPIVTMKYVCERLISHGVSVIVMDSPVHAASVSAMSYISSFYQIPAISVNFRDSSLTDKNIHPSFLRTVPPYHYQADIWIALLRSFGYSSVNIIHSSESDSRALVSRLIYIISQTDEDTKLKIESTIEFETGIDSFIPQLLILRLSTVKVILLQASAKDARIILHDAWYLNMTKNYVWITTEQAIIKDRQFLFGEGVMAIRLRQPNFKHASISDALTVVAKGLKALHYNTSINFTRPPTTCDEEKPWNVTGMTLYNLIKSQILEDGYTGRVAFDSNGDRAFAEYEVVNILIVNNQSELRHVGRYVYNEALKRMKLTMNEDLIIWPGGSQLKPHGYTLPSTLKAVTIAETPFVFVKKAEKPQNCTGDKVPCTSVTKIGITIWHCCWGYCVDLLLALAKRNNIKFTLSLAMDGTYGERIIDKQGKSSWSGMIGELIDKNNDIDIIVSPLAISPERSDVIRFSQPFMYQGISILVRQPPPPKALVSILQPFQLTLWLMLLFSVHAVAVLLWLLDMVSPMYKPGEAQNDSLNLAESVWLSWGVILNSGLGEGTPRSMTARAMAMVWACFAMIIVASYTANLAAFLVLEDDLATITGINDAKVRNPTEDFIFATVKDSMVEQFFRRKTEWAKMYRSMELNGYDTPELALDALKQGTLDAFIWGSSRLDYEASKSCDFVTVGESFNRAGYAFGLSKDLPWGDQISLDILYFHESGYMDELENKWLWQNDKLSCPPRQEGSPRRLGLSNLKGSFMMIFGGIIVGIILIIIELCHYKYCNDLCSRSSKKRQQQQPENNHVATNPTHECEVHSESDLSDN